MARAKGEGSLPSAARIKLSRAKRASLRGEKDDRPLERSERAVAREGRPSLERGGGRARQEQYCMDPSSRANLHLTEGGSEIVERVAGRAREE